MYTLDDEYEEGDPGNQLRLALSETNVEFSEDAKSRLYTLLYTASERSIHGFDEFGLEDRQLDILLKMLKIASDPSYTAEDFKKFRM